MDSPNTLCGIMGHSGGYVAGGSITPIAYGTGYSMIDEVTKLERLLWYCELRLGEDGQEHQTHAIKTFEWAIDTIPNPTEESKKLHKALWVL